MSMIDIKMEGVREACEILSQLTRQMQKKVVASALRSSTRPMLTAAQRKVPQKTGALKKSLRIIRLRKVRSPTQTAVAVKPVFNRTKSGGVNEFYGHFIHGGTKERRSRKGKLLVFKNEQGEMVFTRKVAPMKATPFLADAYSAEVNTTITTFGTALRKSIDKFIATNFKKL